VPRARALRPMNQNPKQDLRRNGCAPLSRARGHTLSRTHPTSPIPHSAPTSCILHPATSGHPHPPNRPDVRERTSKERAACAVPFLLPRTVVRRTAVRRRRREARSGRGRVRTAVVEEEHMSHGRETYSSKSPGWAHTLQVAQALEAKIQREGEGIA
jgi:hypothetical protein